MPSSFWLQSNKHTTEGGLTHDPAMTVVEPAHAMG
jgi:hypothetical protein